ncbi:ATP-binding cassette domain-containing protein [Flammeovirga yaeyamensis]|uniref:ATP-binding cassette domain-containing protein n=1 Tax=Flammeovirga yaeyamensis TaxID=367791 RepID=A0AAX1N702_9BACT|nr:ABC transporter ATP-binding protein [Flammeovirga yaeyamensis]MBB3699672.1 putative ABC transport system ATP-binding protein [Flammeovirga yaeyamensis]NMF36758.1 ABC transporter ATP-binding protein [Flammeovirga yaeyamensis]QWG02201.1 ATP-binding cassette domain-containing protein [Flammeovirga yaeyamensis]
MLKVENLIKSFGKGNDTLEIIKDISFEVKKGESVAIVGTSGSGKTTLLGLTAGLDNPTSGKVIIDDIDITTLSENDKADIRNQKIGFIFQNFQLLPSLTALENVMTPLELQGQSDAKSKAKEMLKEVGLDGREHHYPNQLSGGEQQRVALARAFVTTPKILFADEPTGNLDEETSLHVENLLFELNKNHHTTLVIVTHDPQLAQKADRILKVRDGKIDVN